MILSLENDDIFLFGPSMKSYQILPLRVRVDLGVIMATKGLSTFHKAPELETHYKMQFSVISRTLIGRVGVLTLSQGWCIQQPQLTGPRKRGIIYILCICAFRCFFWVIIFSHIKSTPLRRWAAPQRAIFYISHRLGKPGILLMCLSVPFLIIPSAPIIIDMVVVLRYHSFSISISRSLYLLILWLICYYVLALTYIYI